MDIAGFDLNLLKAFDDIHAERQVTHTGQRICLSQSAMSGALTRLRDVAGDELFVLSPNGRRPTPRADDLTGPVSAALRLCGTCCGRTRSIPPRPTTPSRSR